MEEAMEEEVKPKAEEAFCRGRTKDEGWRPR